RNISVGGPSIIRKPGAFRSNLELTNSLRSNFLAAKQEFAAFSASSSNSAAASVSATPNGTSTPNGAPAATTTAAPSAPSSFRTSETTQETLYIPRIDWSSTPGLSEAPSSYDITAKLFFLPTSLPLSARPAYAREALRLVMRELRVSSISLLIVSFPGMSFEGDCEWEADKTNARQGDHDTELATWTDAIEPLHDQGLVAQLGIAEFGSDKLARFVEKVRVKPVVDQINIKNCCDVPPPLVQLAKEQKIELFVHSDCTDILPQGTLRELLGHGVRGAGVLEDPQEDGVSNGNNGAGEDLGLLKGEITPLWVVKYTAVVRDRGVIENKGYFAGAVLEEE
ncbi:hypothetical protein BD289DRAFT_378333, partial [Coniella lustricola]